ncbi:MAG: 5'-nucleotidase, lipoprotein e(P4) family [Gammaproteobacteria bacterium]
MRNQLHCLIALAAVVLVAACVSQPVPPDLGVLWVRNAAEYHALATQAYAAAAQDLQRLIEDKSWSALPAQGAAAGPKPELKPAIILDIDETVVNNVEFQATLEPPFTEAKFDAWHEANQSIAVPGAATFVQRARDAGVELFYVTNRSCAPIAGVADPCPQKGTTLDDLREAGIAADAQSVMLSDEKPGWTQEKQVRRDLIGKDYRVIMLVGDDLGDFLPCVRKRVVAPCTEPATQGSRKAATEKHAAYWGNGWYVLPNPMYGSWTGVQ